MRGASTRALTIVAVALALGLATAVSPFASRAPDGLNRVAHDHGFAARDRPHAAPVARYAVPGIRGARLAKGAAGFAGTLLVLGAARGVATARGRRRGRRRAAR